MSDFNVTARYQPQSDLLFHTDVRQQVSGRDAPVTAVSLQRHAASVSLFYRTHGAHDYIEVPMTPGQERGSFRATIPGSAVTPPGVDYYLKAGAAFDPAPARVGALAHGIAVALPQQPSASNVPQSVAPGILARTGTDSPLLPSFGLLLVALGLRGVARRRPRRGIR
jgi:hypothetical protein